jgi:hypothetical protein
MEDKFMNCFLLSESQTKENQRVSKTQMKMLLVESKRRLIPNQTGERMSYTHNQMKRKSGGIFKELPLL